MVTTRCPHSPASLHSSAPSSSVKLPDALHRAPDDRQDHPQSPTRSRPRLVNVTMNGFLRSGAEQAGGAGPVDLHAARGRFEARTVDPDLRPDRLDVGEREALLHRGPRSITRVARTPEDRANLGFMVTA